MSRSLFCALLALQASPAVAAQTFHCRDSEQKVDVTLRLTNENARVNQIKGTSKIEGFWRSGRGAYGVGNESTIATGNNDRQYWDQVEGKPTITVWTEEKQNASILYHFTFSKELLGERFENRKVNGWIDPDAPEGGGYPLDLRCSSVGSR